MMKREMIAAVISFPMKGIQLANTTETGDVNNEYRKTTMTTSLVMVRAPVIWVFVCRRSS